MKTITFKRSTNPNAVPCLKYVCMVRWDWDIQCVYLFAISYMPMYLLLNAKWKFWTFLRQYFFSFFLSALYISQTSYFTQSSPYAYFFIFIFPGNANCSACWNTPRWSAKQRWICFRETCHDRPQGATLYIHHLHNLYCHLCTNYVHMYQQTTTSAYCASLSVCVLHIILENSQFSYIFVTLRSSRRSKRNNKTQQAIRQ